VTIASGVTNIVLDAIFIIVFEWGLAGAAVATLAAQCVGGVVPFVYFAVNKKSLLRLCKPRPDAGALIGACTNGLSEFVTNISMSVVSMLYNFRLMKLVGNGGVVAYGAVMYVSFVFVSIFIGYSIGVAPVIGFHYGAGDIKELKSLYKKSLMLVSTASAFLAALAFTLSQALAGFFVGDDEFVFELTARAFRFYSISVLFSGFSIFGSAFFTALNNGFVSAAISFLRTMLFQVVSVLLLSTLFGMDGIWSSLFVSEILAMAVTFIFFASKRKKYRY
jgi:Na+-driven multidrug efflux pump